MKGEFAGPRGIGRRKIKKEVKETLTSLNLLICTPGGIPI
jgi:hypothetical protein